MLKKHGYTAKVWIPCCLCKDWPLRQAGYFARGFARMNGRRLAEMAVALLAASR